MMFSWLMKRVIHDTIENYVRDKVPKILDARLPSIIKEHLAKRFADEPDLSLTKAGFYWAFAIAIQCLWPDVTNETAARWLEDYLPAPVGTAGYDWTPRAAGELAKSYVAEFGEAA